MTDMKRLAEGFTPPRHRVECPVWHSPLYDFTPDGIVCRCKSCRGGTTHFKSKEEALQIWEALGEQKEVSG